jgi:hypothetical protein
VCARNMPVNKNDAYQYQAVCQPDFRV